MSLQIFCRILHDRASAAVLVPYLHQQQLHECITKILLTGWNIASYGFKESWTTYK